jgi:hypothetical protein
MLKRRCQHKRAERLLEGFRTFPLFLPRIWRRAGELAGCRTFSRRHHSDAVRPTCSPQRARFAFGPCRCF